jgi:hypothetical protein
MVSDGGLMNLWGEILAFERTSFDAKKLTRFIERRHKRPLFALRGRCGHGSRNEIEGLVVHLLKALRKLGYLDYDRKRATWSIRKTGVE